jgi:cysteine--tRNA ligase
MTKLHLFNTKTRQIEEFIPQNPANVKIYTCGPTVYNFAHIGNFASYIYWDLLVRTLKINHLTPHRIINITDVGHLASDADDGEDKLEKGAKRENKTVWEIAKFYEAAFIKDFNALNLLPPTKFCRATDYIQEDIDVINTLISRGYTYETSDGIYFDTGKFATYADFARLDLDNLRAGARVDFNSEKHNVSDFAIWKFIKPDEDHAMQWDFQGKKGYPGWHLECSTISHFELGEPLDIHAGGIDHIPIHHTNEIAQSEAAFGKTMANYWLHANFITIDNQKISKSLGNTYSIQDLRDRGFSPLDFKLWILQGHYQSERNFTFEGLTAAKNRRLHWLNRLAKTLQETTHTKNQAALLAQIQKSDYQTTELQEKLIAIINQNLNSAEVFAEIDQNELSLDDWRFVDELFGLRFFDSLILPSNEIQILIEERAKAKQNKDYAKADQIREELKSHNFSILDTNQTSFWQYLETPML